jgi:exodeoxyribonuclease V beta subunit
LLDSPKFMALIDGECYREKAIRYKNNLRYIDLLVKQGSNKPKDLFELADSSWNVIDYKSSFAYTDKHIEQVNYYIKAIREITSQKVEGYICYLLEDTVKIVKI